MVVLLSSRSVDPRILRRCLPPLLCLTCLPDTSITKAKVDGGKRWIVSRLGNEKLVINKNTSLIEM